LLFSSILFKEKMENLGCDPACRSEWGGGGIWIRRSEVEKEAAVAKHGGRVRQWFTVGRGD
jgi:hypothetical protein